jgi:hypothetical protein
MHFEGLLGCGNARPVSFCSLAGNNEGGKQWGRSRVAKPLYGCLRTICIGALPPEADHHSPISIISSSSSSTFSSNTCTMLFEPPPPLSPTVVAALIDYSRELHDYTLTLWTESRRGAKHPQSTDAHRSESRRKTKRSSAPRPPTPGVATEQAPRLGGLGEEDEGDEDEEDVIFMRSKDRTGSNASTTSDASASH